jgi:hypothetical protein
LKFINLFFRSNYSTPVIDVDFIISEPLLWVRIKAKGNDDYISGYNFFAAGNRYWFAPTVLVGLAKLGAGAGTQASERLKGFGCQRVGKWFVAAARRGLAATTRMMLYGLVVRMTINYLVLWPN